MKLKFDLVFVTNAITEEGVTVGEAAGCQFEVDVELIPMHAGRVIAASTPHGLLSYQIIGEDGRFLRGDY
jgi:hypothetical protein